MPRLALFPDSEHLLDAAARLKGRGIEDFTLISPIPLEEFEDRVGVQTSPVKYFSFFGGLLGALAGFALAAGTSVAYPIPVGGRPIVALPPFLLITYEVTILIGVVMTVIGFFFACRFPKLEELAYAPEANVDQFALVIGDDVDEDVDQDLRDAGASEIRSVEDPP
ncbi:MAG: quinol:electron acceptor oxidoreductase subunit ActD [Xanthomonadales bacterium]|nr:quinol:electron acceptor oxidoreductase subunit ActD [Xanthomonadales bacterium]